MGKALVNPNLWKPAKLEEKLSPVRLEA